MDTIDKINIYNEKLIPLIDQIQTICEAEDIPVVLAFQLVTNDEQGNTKLGVQTYFTEDTTQQMIVAANLLQGKMDYYTTTNESIESAIQAHTAECGMCATRVLQLKLTHPEITNDELIRALSDQHDESRNTTIYGFPSDKESQTFH